jgi:hypothetical protein
MACPRWALSSPPAPIWSQSDGRAATTPFTRARSTSSPGAGKAWACKVQCSVKLASCPWLNVSNGPIGSSSTRRSLRGIDKPGLKYMGHPTTHGKMTAVSQCWSARARMAPEDRDDFRERTCSKTRSTSARPFRRRPWSFPRKSASQRVCRAVKGRPSNQRRSPCQSSRASAACAPLPRRSPRAHALCRRWDRRG